MARSKPPSTLLMDAQTVIMFVEAMIGEGIDFSRTTGVLPTHEGETNQFVKERIYHHVSHRVLPALRRLEEKLKQQQKRREKADDECEKAEHSRVRKAS